MERLFQETIARIHEIPLNTDPFLHFTASNIFPEKLYDGIISHLPDRFYYQSIKSYPKRQSIPLNDDQLTLFDPHLYEFWSAFKNAICGPEFLSAILQKFNVKHQKHFSPAVQLIKDKDCYSIGPHTDIPNKIITVLFYLPTTTSQVHLGTALYRPLNPQFICPLGTHHPFEPFSLVGKAPFLPNSAFGFLRSDSSFHGVEPIGKDEKERNLLSYTVWG